MHTAPGGQRWVAGEEKCIFSRLLKVSNVLDSLIVAGDSYQMVGAEN